MFVSRRAFAYGALSIFGGLLSHSRPAGAEQLKARWRRLPLDPRYWPSRGALGYVPPPLVDCAPVERPLAVFLHGYGQAQHVARGLGAWRDEYGLGSAYERLSHPPVKRHFEHVVMLTDGRQREINDQLSRRPFLGCAAACPSTPVAYPVGQVGPRFAAWLESDLLMSARQTLHTSERRDKTALVGVSMGGLLALEAALQLPHAFGAVVGMQSHLDDAGAVHYAERFDELAQVGMAPHVFVLTSEFDVYRSANERFYGELARRGVPSEFRLTPGPHTRGWVYEIGCVEALLWLDRWFRSAPEKSTAPHLGRMASSARPRDDDVPKSGEN